MRGLLLAGLVLMADPAAAQSALGQETDGGVVVNAARSQAGLQAWVLAFRPRALAAGVPAAVFDASMRDVQFSDTIVKRDRNQNEFSKTIWDYLDTAVSADRVALGIKALAANRDLLTRIEAEYGVEAEVVVAVWGLESAYGTFRGDTLILGALATLAYDGRRAAFFEAQLIAALRIVANGDVTVAGMVGSWAGAMGHTQFMPSSWWDYAVDFTGDGKRDIWGDDPADALASTANYLARHGWAKGAAWGLEVRLPGGFDYAQTTERVKKAVADWRALGVVPAVGGALPDHGMASVLLPGGARGAAFLVFNNFKAIEAYNTADAYVIAIGHLADRIKGGPAIAATWPRDLRALSLDERMDLQRLLSAAGFDAGGVDGRMGPKTIAAVKAFQVAHGLVPDGYPSLDILGRLR